MHVVAAVRTSSSRSVVKCATLHAEEGQEAAVRQLCKAWQDAVLARKVCVCARVTRGARGARHDLWLTR